MPHHSPRVHWIDVIDKGELRRQHLGGLSGEMFLAHSIQRGPCFASLELTIETVEIWLWEVQTLVTGMAGLGLRCSPPSFAVPCPAVAKYLCCGGATCL